jgi:hypothetical protein
MCQCLGRTFLIFLNSVFALLGLGGVAAAAYGMVKFSEFSDVISLGALGAVLGMGVVIFLFSIMGAVGACKKNKCMLGFYVVFVSIAVVAEIGAGAFVMTQAGAIQAGTKDCPDGNFVESSTCKTSSALVSGVSDFIDCTYQACCMATYTPPPPSNSTAPNSTAPNDPALSGLNATSCKDKNMAQKPEICTGTLGQVMVNGKRLIDCGEGSSTLSTTPPPSLANLKTFRENLFAFFGDNINVFGGAAIGFGVVQLLAITFACAIMCKSKEEFDTTA